MCIKDKWMQSMEWMAKIAATQCQQFAMQCNRIKSIQAIRQIEERRKAKGRK